MEVKQCYFCKRYFEVGKVKHVIVEKSYVDVPEYACGECYNKLSDNGAGEELK